MNPRPHSRLRLGGLVGWWVGRSAVEYIEVLYDLVDG